MHLGGTASREFSRVLFGAAERKDMSSSDEFLSPAIRVPFPVHPCIVRIQPSGVHRYGQGIIRIHFASSPPPEVLGEAAKMVFFSPRSEDVKE